jgi:hypothetical protein
MSRLRIHQAKLVGPAAFWLAVGVVGVGLGVAFGDSLGQAVLWVVVAVALGLAFRGRGGIAERISRRRPGRRP